MAEGVEATFKVEDQVTVLRKEDMNGGGYGVVRKVMMNGDVRRAGELAEGGNHRRQHYPRRSHMQLDRISARRFVWYTPRKPGFPRSIPFYWFSYLFFILNFP